MEIDQLVAFDRVAREGSFSRAAVAIGIGQPAVSARIQALEAGVGGALFTRARQVALTPLGEGFLPYARRVLEMLDEGVQTARLSQSGARGRIRVGALGSLAGGLLGPALAEFLEARPEVECTARAADHELLVELLLDGILELAVVAWPCREATQFTPLVVLREPVILVAHPRHPLGRRREVTQDEVVRTARPLLRLRWWQTHHPDLLRLADLSGTAVEVSMETARQLVLQGVGAGFFTRTYIAEDLAARRLKEVAVRGMPRVVREAALVRRKRPGPLPPPSLHLVELVRGAARRLRLLA